MLITKGNVPPNRAEVVNIFREALMSKEFDYIQLLYSVICADTHITAVHMLRVLQKEKDSRIVRDTEQRTTIYKLEEPSDLVAHFD